MINLDRRKASLEVPRVCSVVALLSMYKSRCLMLPQHCYESITADALFRSRTSVCNPFLSHPRSFEVRPGPDGYRHFTESIRKAFKLPDDSELNITFTCDEPSTAELPPPPPPPPPPTGANAQTCSVQCTVGICGLVTPALTPIRRACSHAVCTNHACPIRDLTAVLRMQLVLALRCCASCAPCFA